MHVTKLAEARPECGPGWGTQSLTDLSWLLDAELGGSEHGALGRMTIEAGGAQEPHRHPGAAELAVVLEGEGMALAGGRWLALGPGDLLQAPAGAVHALRAGGEGLDLLVVVSAPDAETAGWEPAAESAAAGAEARLLRGHEAGELDLDDAAGALGRDRFAADGAAHELRRHPGAAGFFVLLEGEGVQLGAGGEEEPVGPGDAALLAPGAWHGFRNTGPREARAVSGLLGAAGLAAAGHELREPARSGS